MLSAKVSVTDHYALLALSYVQPKKKGTMPQRLSDVPLPHLIPETREWNEGRGIDLLSWVGCVGSFEHAIAYGELFWPEFVEFDGCIFFAGFSEESYRGFMAQYGENKQAVEAVMSHRHILDFFSQKDPEPTRPQVGYLARLLKEMWSAKLRRDFPEKKMVYAFTAPKQMSTINYKSISQ